MKARSSARLQSFPPMALSDFRTREKADSWASDEVSMATLRYSFHMLLLTILLGLPSSICISGCGSGVTSAYLASAASATTTSTSSGGGSTSGGGAGSSGLSYLELSPVTATSSVDATVSFIPVKVNPSTGANDSLSPSSCDWASNDDSVLKGGSSGSFSGVTPGSATVTAVCAKMEAIATATVTAPKNPRAIRITHGGVYSGDWSSNDPDTPAVTIVTDEAVTITNSTVTGRGTLIKVFGGTKGANLTLTSTTGTALEPGISGKAKGKFLDAEAMNSVVVRNCTMRSASFGIYIAGSKLTNLTISRNIAIDMDDRVSDGKGGYLKDKRVLGHFIMLNGDAAINGGEISWNQIINSVGNSSIEDVISFYQSHGADSSHLISVHDNYIEGALAPGLSTWYTGGGIQFDGDTNDPSLANGFIDVAKNVVVRSAGFGISVAAGHDITVHNNRVVSCGQDGQGNWLNFMGAAYGMWNYYKTHQYYNNKITANTGGLIVAKGGTPVDSDFNIPSVSDELANSVSGNSLDHPCWVNGALSQSAEAVERNAWQQRVLDAGVSLGDRH
ncbi:right-handed parallel beta-helix repeat-containing protein [Terriglobus albidus]|uniref:hypothetical protein n=1 Tax=Terriglobus albidus TaxID=1592106 RepID=UPI0021DF49AC|nr:hypothetical protein [Terriglobus albidus]